MAWTVRRLASKKESRLADPVKHADTQLDGAQSQRQERDLEGLTLGVSKAAMAKSVDRSLRSQRQVIRLSKAEKERLRAGVRRARA